MKRFIAVALALLSVFAFSMSAASTAQAGFVGERQLLDESSFIAHGFWGARGVYPAWLPVITNEMGGDGYYNWQAGRVEINPLLVIRGMYDLDINGNALSSGEPPAQGAVCAIVAHEFGHVGGLQHTQSGIMIASGLRYIPNYWPYECRQWAASH